MGLNKFECLSAIGNTGVGRCALIPKHIVSVILVPNNFQITEANSENVLQFLQGKAKETSKFDRIFPINDIVAFTDNSEEPVVETFGYGVPNPIRDGNYSWTFQFVKGGLCLLKALRKFNKQNISALLVDADGVIFGRKTVGGLAGIPLLSFWANQLTMTDSTTSVNMSFTISFAPRNFIDQGGFIADQDFNPNDLIGLQEISLQTTGAQTGTSLRLQALASCGGENLFDIFGTELADGAVWEVINNATGASLAITSVAANAGDKSFTITLASARTGSVTVSLAPVNILEAADIIGFESDSVVIPAP